MVRQFSKCTSPGIKAVPEIWALPSVLSSFTEKSQENYALPLKEYRIKRNFPPLLFVLWLFCL